jgi:prolyl oligopeptidase
VARIRKEMMQVIRTTDFMKSNLDASKMNDDELFKAFIAYLRTDSRFYHHTPAELLTGYRDICKRVDAQLPRFFRTLPRLTYGVKEIPLFMAPQQTTAYYQHGDIRNAEPGWFMANTSSLDQRPTYEMVALSMHESVPGHHLQIALAQEMADQPEFRKDLFFNAFGEGWALYSERLGIEMGMYADPYDDFGRLLYEMWRACRLVVDPGMHAMGWSRERAVKYMLENTALSDVNINTEVDRYISWPGQACAYKIGELKIRELRTRAEQTLGRRFDLRQFHDVVLGAGAVPLNVLEKRVDAWIKTQ